MVASLSLSPSLSLIELAVNGKLRAIKNGKIFFPCRSSLTT